MKKKYYIKYKKINKFKGKPKFRRIKPGADSRLKKIFASIGTPETKPFVPDTFQIKAISAIKNADCLVTAPTGAGKTWIAQQAISQIRAKGGKAWYASPLKALTNSKYLEFCQDFGNNNVGILTGDRKENPDAPVIVGTTEILRNQLYDAMYQGEDISTDFVILDEAHFLGDEDRGVVWEEIMIYLPSRIPLLMLSATIGNADQIAGWLSKIRFKKCIVVQEHKRPVPLFPLFFHPSGTLFPLLENQTSKKPKLYKKVTTFINNKSSQAMVRQGKLPPFGDILQVLKKYKLLPAIFFLKSRADCDNALEICRKNLIKNSSRKSKTSHIISCFIDQIPHISKHSQLWHLKHLAVGAHHSGQLPAWKLLIESLMTQGLLDAVFATSTVAAGVNFPARTIIFLNSDKFNGIEFLPLSPTEFHQMTGRAGRRGMDNIGFAAIIPGKFMDTRLIAKLINALPSEVLSQIKINFSMALNLLLSHTPDQIKNLLQRSFAAYLIESLLKYNNSNDYKNSAHEYLWQDFMNHFNFLIETGYVTKDGILTEDGIWASQLRVDQPLMIAEGFKKNIFPESNPMLMAAIIASFVNERETDERIEKELVPNKLKKSYQKIIKGLKPFTNLMEKKGFNTRPLYLRPALTTYLWATKLHSWENVLLIAELAEGDLAMLILRTADNLRHITALKHVFPKAAKTAAIAIELILRDPVITFYE